MGEPRRRDARRSGGAGQGPCGRAGQDWTPTGRFAQETTVPLDLKTIEDYGPERLFGSMNKRNPM